MGTLIGLVAVAGCQGGDGPASGTLEVPSGRTPNASVAGTVTYQERLALTPDATLVVELRDVSYADGPAPLIARQTIVGPGQVPVEFEVHYSREDIVSGNRYAIRAEIIESDGRLAFVNDTVHEVITHGSPDRVDVLLVLVQPPPDLVADLEAGSDWRTWVETPVEVIWANLIPNEPEPYLRIAYYQSTMEGCARPGNQGLEVDGNDIIAGVTLYQPPPTPWGIPCHEEVVELDAVEPIREALEPASTYRVIVNHRLTTTFTLPDPALGYTFIAESPVESAEVRFSKNGPHLYELRVVSGMPKGSGCSQFNGYEIRRREANRMEVSITHHEVSDPLVVCTADYPVVETIVPLGSDYESGAEYVIDVNSGTMVSFVAG